MANYSIDFSEVNAPTGKQIDLVQSICRTLHYSPPEEYTFEAYSEFISEYRDDYYQELNEQEKENYYWL
jgi:hypothetical protein